MHPETAIVFTLVGFLLGFCAALALTPRQSAPPTREQERDPADWWKDA